MAKSNKSHEPFPIRSSTHIKESNSRKVFEKIISPWLVRKWDEVDYGVDTTVEITRSNIATNDLRMSGKRFSAQLKSTTTAQEKNGVYTLSIPRNKVTYWYSSIEPFALIYIDLVSSNVFLRWVNEDFVKELFNENEKWLANETVTVYFKECHCIKTNHLHTIEQYILNFRRPLSAILSPGDFFRNYEEAKLLANKLISKINDYGIPFVSKEIEDLSKNLRQAIYTIAIVGPTKAGKSTLINSLLYKNISPVGVLPTTSIPITIFPKDKDYVEVVLKNGTSIKGEATSQFLEDYTSQSKNPDNKKNVKLVSVNLVNSTLERGFALCDMPGLDDPDKEVRNITTTALYNVNAIIYLIDSSSMKFGGFSMNQHIIKDLQDLGGRIGRIFLVFNKVDAFIEDHQLFNQFKDYVDSAISKYEIDKYLPSPPLFLSAQKSYDYRINNKAEPDPVAELEKVVWTFLLKESKSGLHNILGIMSDSMDISKKLQNLIRAKLANSQDRKKILNDISEVKEELLTIRQKISWAKQNIQQKTSNHLQSSFKNITVYLEQELSYMPMEMQLPESSQIVNWLKQNANQIISDAYSQADQELRDLSSEIKFWISTKLKQVDAPIEEPHFSQQFKMPEIGYFTSQVDYLFQDRNTKVFGVLENMFAGIGELFGLFLDFIDQVVTSKANIRRRSINKIIKKADSVYSKITGQFLNNLSYSLNTACEKIQEKSLDRTGVYLGELTNQLNGLDVSSFTEEEIENYNSFLTELEEIESLIQSNVLHLKDYTDAAQIDLLKKVSS